MKDCLELLFAGLLFAVLSSCTESDPGSCSRFNRVYPEALNKEKDNPDTMKLLAVLDNILDRSPDCIDALLTRADLLAGAEQLADAKRDYTSVIKKKKNNTIALYSLGIMFYDEKNYDSALYYFDKAVSTKGFNGFVLDHPANDLLPVDSNAKYDVWSHEIFYYQGLAHYYKGSFQQAKAIFEYCISSGYQVGEAYLYCGGIAIQQGDTKGACEQFRMAKLFQCERAGEFITKFCK
ncbi:MAG: tetratricopeptide repeat protein [Candidatus Pseudobacter hemicellulosilyticus]|uniref:Tetratricopeptide repeat protein n=1 Tax=Candidatus Pseudobacter hemicellulosilyticus TaxID=3121375 RepID=A0AAJ5WYV5_9BACT|nr:MAG: tetratricopeptide repeat protein [Pseudobacter sp.]